MPRSLPPVGFIAPMLPTLVDAAPEDGEWVHEIKFDGYRTLLTIRGKDVHAYTRNGFDWTEKDGPVVASARALRCRSAILDGEMCVQNATGVTDFGALRRAIQASPEDWRTIHSNAKTFLETRGSEAAGKGWTGLSLFGVHCMVVAAHPSACGALT